MSNFVFYRRQRSITNADFGAPRDFSNAINLDLSSSASQFIDTIDFNIIAQPADNAALGVLVVEIFRNVTIDDTGNFDNQILGNGSVRTMWSGMSNALFERNFSKNFDAPNGFQLDNGYRYCIVAYMTNLQGVLGAAVLQTLSVSGRVDVEQQGTLYGGIR